MANESLSKGARAAADVSALLRARNALLWIVTREEARAERLIAEAAAAAGYVARTWDCGQGVADMAGRVRVCVHRTIVCRPLEPYPAPETGQADCWIEERPCYLEENPIAPPPGG